MNRDVDKVLSTTQDDTKDTNRGFNMEQGDLFVSQYDMALVQTAFMGTICMHRDTLGVAVDDDLLDYLHFWRGIGWFLGIEDEYNLCKDTFEETLLYCQSIEKGVLMPMLCNPPMPQQFLHMSGVVVRGTSLLFRGLRVMTMKSFFRWVFLKGLKIPIPATFPLDVSSKSLSWWDYIVYWLLQLNFKVYKYIAPARWLLNFVMLWRLRTPSLRTDAGYIRFFFSQKTVDKMTQQGKPVYDLTPSYIQKHNETDSTGGGCPFAY
jgi:hypothetical protein